MNCLIVEDNDQMRRLLCYLLREVADGGITECNDGGEALAAYEQCQPDVVVMDVQMANTDGIAATKEICAAHPEARVLILTDYNDADIRRVAKQAGASGYLLKDNLLQLPALIAGTAMSHGMAKH